MFTKLSDLDWDSPETQARFDSNEAGYRRGFTQGYSQALDDALLLGCKQDSNWWQSLATFFDKRLMRWRVNGIKGMVPPPSYKVD